jgi:hypothetical protein
MADSKECPSLHMQPMMRLFAFSLTLFCAGYKFGLGDYNECVHKNKSRPDW